MKCSSPRPSSLLAALPGLRARPAGDARCRASVLRPGGRRGAAPLGFDLVGLHWQGRGRRLVPDALASRAAGARWRDAAPEDDAAGRAERTSARARGWRLGSPYWAGAVEPDPGPHVRPRDAACAPTTSGARPRTSRLRTRLDRRLAADHHRARAGTRTSGSAGAQARLRGRGALRGRPPHGRLELVHAGPVGRDRPRHRALPRARERLERHRLQLPRRQVRPGLRGPLRAGSTGTSIGAHAQGFNTRLVRRRADRQLRHGLDHARRAGRARQAPRLAARRRARRPALDLQLALRREPEVPGRAHGHAAHDLRPPRHGLHDAAPEASCTATCPSIARAVARDRPAEALLPGGDRQLPAAWCGSPGRSPRRCRGRCWSRRRTGTSSRRATAKGTTVDWTWDARTVPAGKYLYAIDAGPSVRPATGVVPGSNQPLCADRSGEAGPDHAERRRPQRRDARALPPARGGDGHRDARGRQRDCR